MYHQEAEDEIINNISNIHTSDTYLVAITLGVVGSSQ